MRRRIIYIFVLVILLVAGCKEEVSVDEQEKALNAISEDMQNTNPDISYDILLPDDEISFSHALHSISFSGINERLGGRSYKTHEFSEFPTNIILHQDKFGIHFEFDKTNKDEADELLKQIEVEGKSLYTLVEDSNKSGYYHLTIQFMDEPLTVRLGDLSPITVKRSPPLQVKIERQGFERPAIITETGITQLASVKISEREKQLALIFSEPMDFSVNPNDLPAGEWLDDQTYKLKIDTSILPHIEGETIHIPLNHFIAKSGNYLPQMMPEIIVERVKELTWLDFETHERVGWSERDYLYQSMVFSPNESQYIGVAAMIYDNGHNMDYVYALVLERQGMSPFIIEQGINALPHSGTTVQWIDEYHLLYNNNKQVYVYDLDKKERRVLHDWSDKERSFQQVVYDRVEDKLLVISIKSDKQSEDYRYIFEKFIYTTLDQLILHENYFTDAEIINWPQIPQMPVHITTNGYYWTLKKNNQFITRFEGRDGTIEEFPGVVVYTDNDITLLIEEIRSDPGLNQAFYIWKKGQSPQKAADAPGFIQMVGSNPIVIGEKENFQYKWSTGSWTLWEIHNDAFIFSPQENLGMYKQLK